MEQSSEPRNEIEYAAKTAGDLMAAVQDARTTLQAYMENAGGETNYFKSMELLLRNYYELAQLVADAELYMEDAKRERDKSVVSYRRNAGGMPPDEAEDEAERIRTSNYAYTRERFREIDRVVKIFAARKEMRVIRMYYFGEDVQGVRRDQSAKPFTFEEIASELGNDVKTVRTWRSRIVNDMAVTLFGKGAAIEAATYRKQRQTGLTNAG